MRPARWRRAEYLSGMMPPSLKDGLVSTKGMLPGAGWRYSGLCAHAGPVSENNVTQIAAIRAHSSLPLIILSR